MLIDYGKRAYLKMSELEKRIEKIEKEIEKSTYNTLVFDLSSPENAINFYKGVKFLAKGDNQLKGELIITINSSANANYQIKLNGAVVKIGKISGSENVISFDLAVYDGENLIELDFSSSVAFSFSVLKITLIGQIEYLSQKRKLSLASTTFSDYIIYQNGNFATLYNYSLSSLVKVFDYDDVLDVSLLGYVNEILYIGIVNKENILTLETLSLGGDVYKDGVVLSKNVSSVCGYASGNGVKIVFSKAGEVMQGDYVLGDAFTYQKTGRRGAFVTADADVYGAYVIYGDYKPCKLVDYTATYVLEKGDNYHIAKLNENYIIRYAKEERLYKQEINGVTVNPIKLSACNEIIRLYDGKYIKRVRDVLTIGKEENV